jgi:hypothetical protein
VWEEDLVPLLQRAPALTPITLLEHLQQQQPDVYWIPLQRTLRAECGSGRRCRALRRR